MAARKPKPRRSAKIERQLAVDALAGKRAGQELLVKGLRSLLGLRRNLGAALTTDARTRIRLPYGTRVDLLHCGPDDMHSPMLAIYVPQKGATVSTQLPQVVAGWILDRAHGKTDVIVRALMGIERARRALLDSAEEQTRWL